MDYSEYYEARNKIVEILKKDLVGPLSEDETIDEAPVNYYLVGKLYPKDIKKISDDGEVIKEEDTPFLDDADLLANQFYQSAMGMSISVAKNVERLNLECTYAKYTQLSDEEGSHAHKWKRNAHSTELLIDLNNISKDNVFKKQIDEDLYVQVRDLKSIIDENRHLMITLLNDAHVENMRYENLSPKTYFQPQMIVRTENKDCFLEVQQSTLEHIDDETNELEMLYSGYKSYASGHGCAVNWHLNDNNEVNEIFTDFLPEYEVLQMKPADCFNEDILSIKRLSEADYPEIAEGLHKAFAKYNHWITGLKNESSSDIALRNIAKCEEVYKRLLSAIEVLEKPVALKAFKLANEAMYYQRTKDINGADYSVKWYPFQLAFILLELKSIVEKDSRERQIVDLLWFPTGGGKTEAYLGIAAFTLFYERLSDKRNDVKHVSIIMRYTLRLLSLQQFERAAALICSCEIIRDKYNLGETPFSIGLWVGQSVTPNKLDEADKFLKDRNNSSYSNPAQIKKCPWCGKKIEFGNYYVDKKEKRMHIACSDEKCFFWKDLPIHLVDEDIYAHKPSFIISTVDKFAQLAFKEDAADLLNAGTDNISPQLIIQDELHLISGPLGTMTGIYEAAILKLLTTGGIRPKIVASTATIKNARNQVRALYNAECMQFPPQGICADDSFFAEKSKREDKPARKYLGIMQSGASAATFFVRVMGSLLFASRYLSEAGFSDEVVDSFWTETGYFNTLKELGSSLVRIVDNVQDRYNFLKDKKFFTMYPLKNAKDKYTKYYELTSRNNSSSLGDFIQNDLMISYRKDSIQEPYDFIMSSNMISVGVDVDRLGTMLVVGQPLKTAEYIQATSRVGRKTPGLVVTLYSGAKTRDRSHYEQFIPYHAAFYKYVEPTTLTPFSDRARDRGLQALYIMLARYTIPNLRKNEHACKYRKNMPELEDIRKYILDYVDSVDQEELDDVIIELNNIESEWENQAIRITDLVYYKYGSAENALYKEDFMENNRFRMMNSLRTVEPSIEVDVEE